ncbi:serine/threonine-protein kinase [Pendulispora albinea]|uniref:Serine/threonine protein kinase n=1 Tax=Pendulispora albinea TaxID=2741071 RepID=A0ABZ2M0H4_9BACT
MLTHNVKLVRRVAQGGMGSIWLARHMGLDVPVAAKLISGSTLCKPSAALERFAREARVTARLHHPNVIQILDYGISARAGGVPYIIMEYLEGEELEHAISTRGRLPLDETVSIVQTIADVLERAHQQGIVHRDIKPGNVFLHGPDKVVKVLDFGVARDEKDLSTRTTQAGEIVGTPFFMSPEQFVKPKEVDHRCDLWALGVLAYEALVGRVPFEGMTPTAVYLAVRSGQHARPSQLVPELPPAIDAWFRAVFQPDPARRFASAKAMADALARAARAGRSAGAANERESAEPRGASGPRRSRIVELVRKRSRPAAIVVSVCALAFAGAFLGGSSASSAPAARALVGSGAALVRSSVHVTPLSMRVARQHREGEGEAANAVNATDAAGEMAEEPSTPRASTTRSEHRVRPTRRRPPHEPTSFFFFR